MRRSEQLNELGAAMAKANAEIEAPEKTGTVEIVRNTKRPHLTLYDLTEGVRAIYAKHGLSVLQDAGHKGADGQDYVGASTCIVHASGQWIESDFFWMPLGDSRPWTVAGALSYAKRYSACSMLFIVGAEEDDDGKGNQKAHEQTGGKRDIRETAGQLFLNKLSRRFKEEKPMLLWGSKENLVAWYKETQEAKYGPLEKIKANDDDMAMMELWGKVLEREQEIAENGVPVESGVL